MGIDAGFDIYPPLDGTKEEDREIWKDFLSAVWQEFKHVREVVLKPDRIEVELGEHPTLYFTPEKNRRFSSETSGSRCQFVEAYLKDIYEIARNILGKRASWWRDECGERFYQLGQVHDAHRLPTPDRDLFLLWLEKPTYLNFEDVCERVLAAFSVVHVGMNGLRYDSAPFPLNKNYSVVHKMIGMHSVNTMDDWANSEDVDKDVTIRQAYWATRCNNNGQVLNRTLLHEIQRSRKDL